MRISELGPHLVDEELFADEPLHASFRERCARGLAAAETAAVTLFGVPFDAGTYKHYGVHEGPMGIRQALAHFRTYSIELGIDFQEILTVADIGNIEVANWREYEPTFERIDLVLRTLLAHGTVPVMLGGDHSISFPAIRAFARHHGAPVGVIWIDNHYDTMPPFRGDALFCGCPMRNVITQCDGLVAPENVVHIGSRGYGNSATSARGAHELGFEILTMDDVDELGVKATMQRALELAGNGTAGIYMTVDIDSADVVYAPATQSPRPGGFTSRELMRIVREAGVGGVAAFDVVEVAPAIDPLGTTQLLAAELVLEAIGGVAARMAT
jgi:agmatinase